MSIRTLVTISLLLLMSSAFADTADAISVVENKKPQASMTGTSKTEIKVTMRDHGYTIGDVIAMRVVVRLPVGQVIDANSIPLKGPVNAWLDLRDVTLHEAKSARGKSESVIDFSWQIFATVEHAQQIKIPAIQLQVLPADAEKLGIKKTVLLTIPAQAFHLSPVLPPLLTENRHRPHIPPLRFDTHKPASIAATFFTLGMLLLGVWLWLSDKIAWLPHNPGPMTKLARQLDKFRSSNTGLSQADLRNVHLALNTAASQTLYPHTLEQLFQTSPYLSAERAEITHFFKQSWAVFFESSQLSPLCPAVSVVETRCWVKRAALAERLYRASQRKQHGNLKHVSTLHRQSKA